MEIILSIAIIVLGIIAISQEKRIDSLKYSLRCENIEREIFLRKLIADLRDDIDKLKEVKNENISN